MKVTIDLPEIEGFEYTGEYRGPNKGEHYYDEGKQLVAQAARHAACPILKKKAPVYKTYHAFQSDVRFVELKALEAALNLVSFELSGTEDYKALKELIK